MTEGNWANLSRLFIACASGHEAHQRPLPMIKETFRGFCSSKPLYIFRYIKEVFVLKVVYTVNIKKSNAYKTTKQKNT